MSYILEDGKGSGIKAKVNSQNRLEVNARSEPSEESEAVEGRAFILHAECYTDASTGGGLLYVKNNSTAFDMHVTRIYIDPFTLTDTDLRCLQIFDPTLTANGTAVVPVQKNRGTADTFDLTLYASDASNPITYTGGTQYHNFALTSRAPQQRNMNGTNVVPAGKAILWAFNREGGGVATDNQVISLSVNITKIPQ